jgi:hypothetical protein
MTKQAEFIDILSGNKNRRRHRRGQIARPVQKKGQKVELGYPANLTKFCFDAEGISPAPPLERLLKQTINNCRRLQQLRPEELQPYARGMAEFPMLVSFRTSQMEVHRWLKTIKLSADRGPAYRFNAHWPDDDFSRLAEEFVFKLWGTAPCRIPVDLWKFLRPGMRLAYKDHMSENPRVAKHLESLIPWERDRRSPGRLRERVISNLLERTKNFFDLRSAR